MPIRSPIVAVLGHVDHGKTSILDAVRKSKVAKKEAGGITQMIGASYVSSNSIREMSGDAAKRLNINLTTPGLLFIDTPGHEAFSNIRERGGSIADIAILVVDVMQGFQPQTIEAIRILKSFKTPFIIAANKIDLIKGWRNSGEKSFLFSMSKQSPHILEELDNKIYNLVAELSKENLNSERFDRVDDFTQSIAIIPVSAKTEEGLAELLLLVAGLSEKYMKKRLEIHPEEKAKGTVIEVKEELGLGTTIDVIIYDGILKKNDNIFIMKKNGVCTTKVRALLQPNVSSNNPKEKYRQIDQAVAAAGVKIMASGLEGTIPGSPFSASNLSSEELKSTLSKLIFESRERKGVIIKADSLGSLEAIVNLFKSENISIYKADIGGIDSEDIQHAKSIKDKDMCSCIMAFNIKIPKEMIATAQNEKVKLIDSNIIYKLADMYKIYLEEKKEQERKDVSVKASYPVKIRALPGFFFRLSKPAVFGIHVICGKLRPGMKVMNEKGEIVGEVKSVQDKNLSLKEANTDMKVAVSIEGPSLNKDIKEGDVLYAFLSNNELSLWESKKEALTGDECNILKEIKIIINKRKINKKDE